MEDYIRQMIATGEVADGKKIDQYIWTYAEVIDEVDQEDYHRWWHTVSWIFELDGKYYIVDEQRGNTEYQESEFPDQVIEEVEQVPITVMEWHVKKRG